MSYIGSYDYLLNEYRTKANNYFKLDLSKVSDENKIVVVTADNESNAALKIKDYLKKIDRAYDLLDYKDMAKSVKSISKDELDGRQTGDIESKGFSISESSQAIIFGYDYIKEDIDAEELKIWEREGFSAKEIKAWIDEGFDDAEEAKEWADYDFEPMDANEWRMYDFTPRAARKAIDKGYDSASEADEEDIDKG